MSCHVDKMSAQPMTMTLKLSDDSTKHPNVSDRILEHFEASAFPATDKDNKEVINISGKSEEESQRRRRRINYVGIGSFMQSSLLSLQRLFIRFRVTMPNWICDGKNLWKTERRLLSFLDVAMIDHFYIWSLTYDCVMRNNMSAFTKDQDLS